MSERRDEIRIQVTERGPYLVTRGIEVRDAGGEVVASGGAFLCRCGGSRNKPFCDGTHKKIGFTGEETADHGAIADRRDTYEGEAVTIYDDRSVCSHAGECTQGLPSVWRMRTEPWIDPTRASPEEIAEVVRRCPSGALSYAFPESDATVEKEVSPAITASKDGPYHVRGGIQVRSTRWRALRTPRPADALPLRRVEEQAVLRRLALEARLHRRLRRSSHRRRS